MFNLSELLKRGFIIEFELFLKKHYLQLNQNISKFNIIRVDILLNSIWKFNPILVKIIFSSPEKFLAIAENSLNKIAESFQNLNGKSLEYRFYHKINLIGPFGYQNNKVVTLGAWCIGELISVKGYIVFNGKIKTKRNHSVFFCEKTDKLYVKNEVHYNINNSNKYSDNFKSYTMEIEHGLSRYIEEQKIVINENQPEKNIINSQQNLNIYINNDLVDSYNIGDEIDICGIYKPIKLKNLPENFSLFETYLSATSIKKKKYNNYFVASKLDFLLISYFSMFSDCFERLSSLIVPHVQGMELLKKSFLLMLLNSNRNKNMFKLFLHQNINLLLIGGDELIKDEFISFISKIFSIFSINKYEDILMILKNKKIDEFKNLNWQQKFEKISKILNKNFIFFDNLENLSYRDKISIGEILEKGIEIKNPQNEYISENSFPSVIGCVKIKETSFNHRNSIQKNIDFPEILYNQFDIPLFFPKLLSNSKNHSEANFVLCNHRFFKSQDHFSRKNFFSMDIYSEEDYDIKDKIKKNFNKNFISVNFKNISNNFLKNYIYYARSEIKCFLSNEVVEFLINTHFSSKINSRVNTKNNIRMIETIIRLCFSYTKCHLRCMVSIKDADYIFSFLNTIKNIQLKIKPNQNDNFFKEKIESKEARYPNIYFTKEVEKKKKYYWLNFEIQRIKYIKTKNSVWNFNTIHITSFTIKNYIKCCKLNSFFERAVSIWNAKIVCIFFGRDFIKIQ